MSIFCELVKKQPMFGCKRSNANNCTKKVFHLNIKNIRLKSFVLKRFLHLHISNNTLRNIDYYGSVDDFLLKSKNSSLTTKGLKIKKEIKKLLILSHK